MDANSGWRIAAAGLVLLTRLMREVSEDWTASHSDLTGWILFLCHDRLVVGSRKPNGCSKMVLGAEYGIYQADNDPERPHQRLQQVQRVR